MSVVLVNILFSDKPRFRESVDASSLIGSLLDDYPGYEFSLGELLNYGDSWNTLGENETFIYANSCIDLMTIKISNHEGHSITTKMSYKRNISEAFSLFERVAYKKNKKLQQWSYCFQDKHINRDAMCKDFLVNELSDEISIVGFPNLISCYSGITFSYIASKEMVHIDKSKFIENVLERRKSLHSVILRPRRCGKSFNLKMLYHFLNVNSIQGNELISNLEILKRKDLCEKHKNKYPVILLSFNDVFSSLEDAKRALFNLLNRSFNEFNYLTSSKILSENEKEKLSQYQKQVSDEQALEFLVNCLCKHHQSKVVLLVDEYETPLLKKVHPSFRNEIIELMSNLFSFLKRTEQIEFSIFIGIVQLKDNGYLSGLQDVICYSSQNDNLFTTDFGITHTELAFMLNQVRGKGYPGFQSELDKLKNWYSGYDIHNKNKIVFNMWSICSYFSFGKISDYWISSGTTGELAQLLNNDSIDDLEMIEELETLKDGGEIEINMSLEVDVSIFTCGQIKRKHELFWKLLFYAGYLTGSKAPQTDKVKRSGSIQTDSREKNPKRFFLRCPNEEVRSNIESSFISKIETRNRSWNEISSNPSPGRDEVNDMIDIELSYLDIIYMDATTKTTLTNYSSLTKLLAQLIPNDVKKKPFSYQYIHPTRNTNVQLTDISVGNGYLSKIFSSQNLIKFIGKKK